MTEKNEYKIIALKQNPRQKNSSESSSPKPKNSPATTKPIQKIPSGQKTTEQKGQPPVANQVNAAYEAAGKMQTGQQPANLNAQKQEQPAPIRENTVANSNQSFAEKALAKFQ